MIETRVRDKEHKTINVQNKMKRALPFQTKNQENFTLNEKEHLTDCNTVIKITRNRLKAALRLIVVVCLAWMWGQLKGKLLGIPVKYFFN